MTAADTLRQAATLLRQAASADGLARAPWWGDDLDEVQSPDGQIARAIGGGGKAPYPTSRYIALMHPGVGLALADWLEEAARHRQAVDVGQPMPGGEYALAVARQLLGTGGQADTAPPVAAEPETETPSVDRAAILREAADECDEAGAAYVARAQNEHAAGAFALMETFRRKADEAEPTPAATEEATR